MEGLSGIRIGHCSFHCSRPRCSAAKQELVLLGFRQTSSSFKCCGKGFTPTVPILKASLQEEAAIENVQTPLAEEALGIQAEEEVKNDGVALEEGPKVNVKFVLEKKCKFGQRFNVIGNDPIFGSWEIEAAIPMEWAEGDIWTIEMNVPVEKEFEFKFILTGENGEVVWQPGSNRVLKTVGDISPLVVNEVWDSVDEAEAVEVSEESKDPTTDPGTTSETDGVLVPADILGSEDADKVLVPADILGAEDAAKDEIVKALESKDDGTNVHAEMSESDLNAAPEVPMAELDIAATTAKSLVGAEDTV